MSISVLNCGYVRMTYDRRYMLGKRIDSSGFIVRFLNLVIVPNRDWDSDVREDQVYRLRCRRIGSTLYRFAMLGLEINPS